MTHRIPESIRRALLLAVVLSPCVPGAAAAQSVGVAGWDFGVSGEIVSRYVWRGEVLDNAGLQPDVHVEHGSLTVGVWSAWGLTKRDVFGGKSYQEIDTYVSWSRSLHAGNLIFTGTDYYFPFLPGDAGTFTNFKGVVAGQATGAHTDEIAAELDPKLVPLTFMVAWNVYNDPDHSLFAQVGGNVTVPVVGIELHGEVGFLPKDSPHYYGTGAWHAMEYTLKATRSFGIGGLEPHVSAAVVRAPVAGGSFGVFTIGF